MNRRQILVAAVVTFVAVAGVSAWWAHRPRTAVSTTAMSGDNATPGPTDRKILYWHDPMVPARRFDKPGKSPFMEMPLVPVYADEVSDGPGVRVSSAVAENLGIRIGKVEKTNVRDTLSAAGSVAFDEHRVALVQARVTGYVTRLLVRAPLDPVHKGQPLAEITSPEWLQAQREYAALLADHASSADDLRAAARQRLTVLDVPVATIAEIERTGIANPTTTIVAPIAGVVTDLGIRDGATFTAGATLFRINGLATVWVNTQVPEAQRYRISVGAAVVATASGWPGQTFRGRVEALLPEVDATTRTLTARAVVENLGAKLSPGMFVTVELAGPLTAAQLVVPSEAIIATGRRTVVITAGDSGQFGVATVTTGTESGGKTVILSGLKEGDSIVLSGQFLIDSEASLTSTIDRLTTPAAGSSP
jgi:Cu(I)/Ag(I) efflux system membrane fusion protein